MSSNDRYNHEKTLIMMFREKSVEPTGRREVTGLRDIDAALADVLSKALSGAMVSEITPHNRAYANFIARPPADQILVGHFDDLRDLVRSIRQAKAGRPSKHGDLFANPDALPIINITRTMDLQYGYSDRQVDRQEFAEVTDANNNNALRFVVAALPVQLIYTMTIAAGDKESLSMLCNLLMSHFYALHSTSFLAPTRLCGLPVELDCAMNNLKGGMVTDVSLPISDDRIYATQMTFDVQSDALTAHEVNPVERKYQVGIKPMDEVRAFPKGGL